MTSKRTSTRSRPSAKKYSVDAFDGLEIDDDDLNDISFAAQALLEDADDDVDFEVGPNPPSDPGEDDQFDPADLDSDIDPPDQEDDYDDVEKPTFHGPRKRKRPEYGKTKPGRAAADPRFQPRGLLEPATRGSKEVQRLFMFGPAPDDQGPPLQGHFKWSAEPTTPSRKPTSSGFGGFTRTYFITADATKKEADEDWDWYELEGGKDAFHRRQTSSTLTDAQGESYMPSKTDPLLSFVMGPYKHQHLFKLPVGSSLDLNQAWRPSPSSTDGSAAPQDPKSIRHGWMINLGERVQCLDWAPNHDGSRQFLAVSTLPELASKTDEQPYESSKAPAFTPQPPYKSCIQLWEFTVGDEGRISSETPPKLRKVVCTTWADVRLLKWCPTPRTFDKSSRNENLNLGLLAAIFGDGSARVLDLSVSKSPDKDTEHVHLRSTAFVTRPPNTICTCLTWLSSNSLAIGCADGTLGIWNIPTCLKSTPESASDSFAEPVIYSSLATTYILSLVSCYPSRPNILLATTMAGHLYMLDLADLPTSTTFSPAATIRSTRSRIGRTILVWHDWSQMVLSADDNFTLVAYPLRRFFRQIGCTRYKSSALTVAVSPVHPFVLAGCVGGEATCNNPLRRAYESKVPIWNQIWFTHEWRAGSPAAGAAAGADASNNDGTKDTNTDAGTSRILEGYKCEQIKLFNTEDSFTHRENGAIYTTVYESRTSVTVVAWNPNQSVGGWCAAGMASGLLRVEDIAS